MGLSKGTKKTPTRYELAFLFLGGPSWARTKDLLIMSQLL